MELLTWTIVNDDSWYKDKSFVFISSFKKHFFLIEGYVVDQTILLRFTS